MNDMVQRILVILFSLPVFGNWFMLRQARKHLYWNEVMSTSAQTAFLARMRKYADVLYTVRPNMNKVPVLKRAIRSVMTRNGLVLVLAVWLEESGTRYSEVHFPFGNTQEVWVPMYEPLPHPRDGKADFVYSPLVHPNMKAFCDWLEKDIERVQRRIALA